ncbi:hypothetical protein [Micromonospora sp. NPDC005367]|uniref:hypothetical protein n=1 Tax=Micromonospora sp. NPDC005367 TaxID=3155590 RepID=UPI0033B32A87
MTTPALLAQICADKRLDKLNLRLLAPTVLASQANRADIMAALRKAGYAPRQQNPDGRDVLEKPAVTAPDGLESKC